MVPKTIKGPEQHGQFREVFPCLALAAPNHHGAIFLEGSEAIRAGLDMANVGEQVVDLVPEGCM